MNTELWLKSPREERCLLAVVNYLNNGQQQALVSTHPFISKPGDLIANRAFDDLVLEPPRFRRTMDAFVGVSSSSRSSFTLFDHQWLNELRDGNAFNQVVSFYLGDKDWAFNDFIKISEQLIENKTANGGELVIETRDPSFKLDKVIETSVFSSGPNKNKPMPLCIGKCFNVEPMIENAATHTYRVNYRAVQDVPEVRDNGVPVSYSKDVANGLFTLNQAPVGRITCDVEGVVDSTFIQYPADALLWLLSTFTNESNIDVSGLPAYDIGLFYQSPPKVRELVDLIVNSISGFHFYTRTGQFVAKPIPTLTNNTVGQMTLDDCVEKGMRIRTEHSPASKVKVNYAKNHSVQQDVAGAVSSQNRALFNTEFQSVEVVNNLPDYPDAQPYTIDTCLVNQADAQALCSVQANILSTKRTVYELEGFATPFLFELGEEIEVTYPNYGFEDGQNAIVLMLDDAPSVGEVSIELWR